MSAFSQPFQSSIDLHNTTFPDGVEIVKGPDYDNWNYGTLKISLEKTSITKKPVFFRFTTDCSGSMSDKCKDGRTKMDHIQHTMCNMLHFFAENDEAVIFVDISAFDDQIHKIIPTTQVTAANINELVVAINKMRPMNSTNIELALQDADVAIQKHLQSYPDHSVSHIFMTDGDATAGVCSPEYLASLVAENCSSTFIAFGLQHNVDMMQKLGASSKNSSNWLIDKLENAGLVYGEILNNELFKVLENVEISMSNGVIYDYKKGCFVDKLYIGNLVTEVEKVYHVLAFNREIIASIVGTTSSGENYSDVVDCLPNLLCEDGAVWPCDLTEQIFRLRAQQLMFESKNFDSNEPARFPRLGGMQRQNAIGPFLARQNACIVAQEVEAEVNVEAEVGVEVERPIEIFRKKLSTFLEIMQKYMKEKTKEEDPFMKGLCDDIYLTIRSLGTYRQRVCVSARESSQGRQQCYNVTDFDFDAAPENTLANYNVSRSSTNAAYQTPRCVGLMRTCSAPIKKNIKSGDEQELEA
jgi:uncharacterized protein YegL